MPEPEKADRVSVFVRLSLAADRVIDARAAQMGGVTRSRVVEAAIERFVPRMLVLKPSFEKHPLGAEAVLRKFIIDPSLYELLVRARATLGYSHQDILRHAIGDLTGVH
jgi:hypothetical protein